MSKDGKEWEFIKAGMAATSGPTGDWIRKMVEKGILNKGVAMESFQPGDLFTLNPGQQTSAAEPSTPTLTDDKVKLAQLEVERDMLRRDVIKLKRENIELASQREMLRMQLDGTRRLAAQAQQRTSAPAFITKHLKFIIFACHPDRNPGRGEALEVTKELLKLRGE